MIDKFILHYKIIEKLGEGGMGEVYKALDNKLDRFVALKFLSPQFSTTEDEKRRFIKEAKAASSLNHPNICTIYDIHEYEDLQFRKQLFMVMEYVEGETIKNIVGAYSNKPLPINDVINIGIQIAEGLNAAHEKGIIHRDIKPENIMLRKDGRVQVMDFGLAKLYYTSEVSRLTKSGTTMGTLGYMSPEQVEGLEVDYRSDIFSLGVVLYELLAGESPFKGIHDAAVIYKIVNSEAPPLSTIRKDIDPLLDLIILKCLEKDKERRYQSSKEFADDLRNIKKIYEREDIKHIVKIKRKLFPKLKPIRRRSISPSGSIKIESNKRIFQLVLITAVILALLMYYFFYSSAQLQVNPAMSFHEMAIPFTQISNSSISTDGNWIAFGAAEQNNRWDIYYMHTKHDEPFRITFDTSKFAPARVEISPDGGQIIYSFYNPFIYPNEVNIISTLGGKPRKIIVDASYYKWRPDGKRIGFIRTPVWGIKNQFYYFWSIKPDGSNPKLEFIDSLTANIGRFAFSYSPDGNSIIWIRTFKGGYQELFIRNLITGKEKQLTFDTKNIDDVCWTNKKVILFSSNKSGNTNIWMISESGGKEIQLTKGNGPDMGISFSSFSSKILYYQREDFTYICIGNLENNKVKQITFDERVLFHPSFSHDRQKIAFTMERLSTELSEGRQIYIMDRSGKNRKQITSGNFNTEVPRFSPNGKILAYTRYPLSVSQLDSQKVFIVDPNNPAMSKYVCDGGLWTWLNDTTLIVYINDHSELVSINGKMLKKGYKDSTFALPVCSEKLIFYIDIDPNKGGLSDELYVISADYERSHLKIKPKKLPLPLDDLQGVYYTLNSHLYWLNSKHELWRLNYLTLKTEKVGTFENIYSGLFSFYISDDEKEIVYVEPRRRGKLIMTENSFLTK